MLQVIPTGFYVSWIVWHTPHILRIMTPLYFWILLFQVSRFPESRNLQVAMIFTKQLHQLIRTPLLSTIYSNSLRRLQSLRFILTIHLVWMYKLLVFGSQDRIRTCNIWTYLTCRIAYAIPPPDYDKTINRVVCYTTFNV